MDTGEFCCCTCCPTRFGSTVGIGFGFGIFHHQQQQQQRNGSNSKQLLYFR
jgi:hypothetical protein